MRKKEINDQFSNLTKFKQGLAWREVNYRLK